MKGLGRTGFSTGACAAAAAKAAAMVLAGRAMPESVEITFPDGSRDSLPVTCSQEMGGAAEASVRKFAGDDPDVTDGVTVIARIEWRDGADVSFAAGEGIGTVTAPGLSVPPGEPAINPAPRRMIFAAVREVTERGALVTVSIPGGRELAEKTFNPRLGVVGGLSVLGTTGRVRPFSAEALRQSLVCALDVAAACGVREPALVPGHIGERAARRHFALGPRQVIEVSNEWGFVLDEARKRPFERCLVVGHPGKLAKLADGQWDTHSSRSDTAAGAVAARAAALLGREVPATPTVEGVFAALPEADRQRLGCALAAEVRGAIIARLGVGREAAVVLVDMQGEILGQDGDLTPWRRPKA